MSGVAAAIAVGSAVVSGGSSFLSSRAQKKGAQQAAAAMAGATDAAIQEQDSEFEEIQKLFKPYIETGEEALGIQRSMAGLGGLENYQQQLDIAKASPQYQALINEGEEAILQNAAASGQLRGGNTLDALRSFRPSVLADVLNQQYNRLGGFSTTGANMALNQANFGQTKANNVGNLIMGQGQIQSQAQISNALANSQLYSGLGGSITKGLGGLGQAFGGNVSQPQIEAQPINNFGNFGYGGTY